MKRKPLSHTHTHTHTYQQVGEEVFYTNGNGLLHVHILCILIAIFAPMITPYPKDVGAVVNFRARHLPPSLAHWFGTDDVGRDVLTRVAFGEPITHRQAVAFMIANIGIELEAMRLMTWRAASRAEQGLPFHREAYLARVLVTEKAMQIGTDGVQLLGGHGFTKEHPVERWYRDLRAIGVAEGVVVI